MADLKKEVFDITGMSCAACAAHIEKAVCKLDGATNVNVNLLQNKMTLDVNPDKLDAEKIIETVVSAGYGAEQHQKTENRKNDKAAVKGENSTEETEQMKNRLIISFVFWIPLMYLGMGKMMGLPVPEIFSGHENIMILSLTELLLVIPIIFVNRKFFINGFRMLFKWAPNMDSLIALGSSASFIYSLFSVFQMAYFLGRGNINSAHNVGMNLYFESAGTILTLITLGKYFEAKSKSKTTDSIRKIMDLTPKTAVVEKNGAEIEISAEDVQVGDIVIVKAGQRIPVDGVIVTGNGSVDESIITGESLPIEKKEGDFVTGATINKSGYFKFQAVKVGENTALSKIIELVEEAASSKAPISKLADRISGIFVPVVICISILTFIIWILLGKPVTFSLSLAVAVLVISCPCALGLATPTAIMVGTGNGAENGILIKSAESLETAHEINTVILDKTGTITQGKPAVTDVVMAEGISEDKLLKTAASIENLSEHPLAAAILDYTFQRKILPESILEYQAIPGEGLSGILHGKEILAGNVKMMESEKVDLSKLQSKISSFVEEGKTILIFTENKEIIGMIAIADDIKETSPQAVSEFKKMGIDIIMMTGDNERTALSIAKKVNIEHVIANVLPEDKEKEVRKIQNEGKKVAMIGDGINDAPALTRADVGIAIGAGTDVAIESADIVLIKNSLLDAVTAIRLSKAVIRNIKENLFWAFIYNIIGIPVAAGILYNSMGIKLNPMIAAAAMSFSSVFVVCNALRLKFFKSSFILDEKSIQTTKNSIIRKEEYKLMKKTVNIEGMMCSHCQARVEKALNGIDGVSAKVSLENNNAVLDLTKDVSDNEIRKAVEDAGYEVTSIKS